MPIENIDYVICPICKRELKQITMNHLSNHGILCFDDFVKMFPEQKTVCKNSEIIKTNKEKEYLDEYHKNTLYDKNVNKYNLFPKKCKECNDDMPYDKRGNMFCCSSCFAINSNRKRTIEGYKCSDAHKIKTSETFFKNHPENVIKNLQKKIIKDTCKCCGDFKCTNNICVSYYKTFKCLNKYFGFDLSVIGTKKVFDEYDRILKILNQDYFISLLSTGDMTKKYNIPGSTLRTLLNKLQIKIRNSEEAGHNASLNGKKHINHNPSKFYKYGYHINWENKTLFYRSSYELEYCKYLDDKKISYEMEHFRIKYFDTQANKFRVAIPDFYLTDTNTLVEIKSSYTFDKQNMVDRFIEYNKRGFNVKLVLDKKEQILIF